jgi:hypothetical protein
MVMDGFSAILVAVPLVLPFAARFHLHPFHVAVMFLLNLELAFMLPPLGLNLFISSFRFSRPVVSLYRVVLPFSGLVALGLALIMYVPRISTALLDADVAAARARAAKTHSAPREAWQLECVQEDHTNPLPCTPEEIAIYGANGKEERGATQPATEVTEAPAREATEDELFQQMLGAAPDAAAAPTAAGAGKAPELMDDDELFRQMMGDAGAK